MPTQNNNLVNPHGFENASLLKESFNRFWYNAHPHINANIIAAKKNPIKTYRVKNENPAAIEFQKLLVAGHTNNALPLILGDNWIGGEPSKEKSNDAINTMMVNNIIAESIDFFISWFLVIFLIIS